MYLKQTRPYNCGYVSIINMMKCLGYQASKKDLKTIEQDYGLDKDGMTYKKVSKVLNDYGIDHSISRRHDLQYVLNILETKPVIIGFTYYCGREIDGHFIVVMKEQGKLYALNNASFSDLRKIDHYKDLHYFKSKYPISKSQLANYLKVNEGYRPDIIIPTTR